MKIESLKNVTNDKVVPFGILKIGQTFRLEMDIPKSHLCVYTKTSDVFMTCDHGGVTLPLKTLVKPV